MPQTRRKTLKRVKMGKGFRWSYGGKLISAVKAKRVKAARKLTGTKPRKNPAKKTTRRYVRSTTTRKPVRKRAVRKTTTKRRTIRKVRVARANPPKRKRVSAATRRKISLALKRRNRSKTTARRNPPKRRVVSTSAKRRAAAKKGWATRRRNARSKTVARKKTTRRRVTRRRKTTTRRRRPVISKAKRRAAALKGIRRKKARGGRKLTSKRRVRHNPPRRGKRYTRTSSRYARKTKFRLRRKPYGRVKNHRLRRRTYKHNRTGAKHYRYRIIKRNPGAKDIMGLVKKTLPIYGGFIAARVIKGLAQTHVVNKYLAGKLPAQFAGAAAPAITFLASVFIGPKVLKGATGGKILEGLQLGSLMTTFDAVLGAVLPANIKAQIPGIAGYDDMGVMGMGSYLSDPTGYSLPPAHATMEPGMGLDVNEAMALDAYVADDGMGGFGVQEALADSESVYMQSGGAGGSLAKTVFTY